MRLPSCTTQLTILAAVALGVAACESPSEPRVSGQCIGVANVDGVNFVASASHTASERIFLQGEVVATVSRRRRCDDSPDPTADAATWNRDLTPFKSGDSNMFAVGTRLCAIVGESPEHLLMLCDRDPADKRILTSDHDEPIF